MSRSASVLSHPGKFYMQSCLSFTFSCIRLYNIIPQKDWVTAQEVSSRESDTQQDCDKPKLQGARQYSFVCGSLWSTARIQHLKSVLVMAAQVQGRRQGWGPCGSVQDYVGNWLLVQPDRLGTFSTVLFLLLALIYFGKCILASFACMGGNRTFNGATPNMSHYSFLIMFQVFFFSFLLHVHRPSSWQGLQILPAEGMLGDLSLPCLQLTHTCSLRVREGREFDRHQKAGGCRLDGELSPSHSHTHLHPSARLQFSLRIANSSFLILESTAQLKHLRVLSLMWQKAVLGVASGSLRVKSWLSPSPARCLMKSFC